MAKSSWDFKKITPEILNSVGGIENINDIYHCATRLRIVVKNPNKVDVKRIENIDGILGVVLKGNEVQSVVGQQVDSYYNGFLENSGFKKTNNVNTKNDTNNKKLTIKNALSTTLDFISGVVLPVMPVFVAAGFLMALLNLSKTFFGLDPKSGTAIVLSAISSAGFYFLPIYTGYQAAEKMKIPGSMGAFLGAILVSNGINNTSGLSFLNLGIGKTQYNGTILPVILGVIILSIIYRSLNKYLPKEVTYFFTPLISIVITLPLVLLFIGPLSNTISNGLADIFSWLSAKANWLAFALYSALNPILVMFGIDKGFIPIVINNMSKMGYDTLIYPAAMTSNAAMGAAALSVAFQSHKFKTRGEGFSAGITGILGITEPSIFGFLLPYRRALFGAISGGAIGGLIGGIFKIKQGALMSPGAISLVSYFVGPNPTSNFIFAVIAMITSIIASFLITTILIRTDNNRQNNKLFINDASSEKEYSEVKLEDNENKGSKKTITFKAPTSGEPLLLSNVNDEIFANLSLGDGFALNPDSNRIVSPVSGTITTIFPTKHAIGIKTKNGLEILLHMGIDTVSLNGDPFTIHTKIGENVDSGQYIVDMDRAKISNANKSSTIMVVITNMEQVDKLELSDKKHVSSGDDILKVTLK